jgi:signal transduction histidine kinase
MMGARGIGRLDAVDLGTGALRRGRIQNIGRKGRAGLGTAPQLWVLAALCLSLLVVEQVHPLAFRAPTLRASIETEITLSALAAACLFGLSFGHRRHLRDLVLVGALLGLAVIDLASYVLPAATHLGSLGPFTAAPMVGKLVVAIAIVAGVWAEPGRQVGRGRRPLLVAIIAGLLGAGIVELGGLALRGQTAPSGGAIEQGVAAAIQHSMGVVLAVATAVLLAAAALRAAATARQPGSSVSLLLGGAMVVFAAARLNYLVLPTPGVGWVTLREGLRIAAYGLMLAAALRQEAVIRREIAASAAAKERRRIARDLHDGLAQDLAFIAAHGNHIAQEAGEDHPLAIAARRALAMSRGAIADLSATDAPSAGAALRQVADELEIRFGVRVSVNAEDIELSRDAREDVVRIVREAIVNAAHGQARNIVVSLTRDKERFILRVLDDGAGIRGAELKARPGFGLRAMGERATSLGGGLTARAARDGGTELEVVFP